MNKLRKIGILLDSTICSRQLYETVSELVISGKVEIFYLLNKNEDTHQGVLKKIKYSFVNKGLIRGTEWLLFKLLIATECKVISCFSQIFSQMVRENNKKFNISKFTNNILYLNPIFSVSRNTLRFTDVDIENIKSLNLDIIIRGNIRGILNGEIINSAKRGIIYINYGDKRFFRGGPPGFWEVYFRNPSTGFSLQILSEDNDESCVVFRGEIPTRRIYTSNIFNLYIDCNPYLAQFILQHVCSNHFPSTIKEFPYGRPIFHEPTISQSVMYIFKTFLLLFYTVLIERFLLGRKNEWSVSYIKKSWRKCVLQEGVQIRNPPNRYFADPFVITKMGKTICYVEDYYYKHNKGCITAIEIIDDMNYEILGPVIDEPFHMSFPFIFEYEHDIYMVPETNESNSVRLYKCVGFPLQWDYQKDILSDISVTDTMIFKYKNKWWLLCNIPTGGNKDYCSILNAYYSNSPISDVWAPHKLNPLIFDSNIARNGGILDIDCRFPVRARQKQGFNAYGKGLTLAKIKNLTPSTYSEELIGQINDEYFLYNIHCHHIHSNENYTVYDYRKFESFN